jgi:hypothetical protein
LNSIIKAIEKAPRNIRAQRKDETLKLDGTGKVKYTVKNE